MWTAQPWWQRWTSSRAGSGLAALALLALAGCPVRSEVEPRDVRAARVTLAKPLEKRVAEAVEVVGWTAPAEQVEIRTPIDGLLIDVTTYAGSGTQEFAEGRPVKKGDLLFVVAQRAHLAGKWIAAQTSLRKAEGPQAVEAAKAEIDELRRQLNCLEVRAPVNGMIGRRLIAAGNLVKAQESLLAKINVVDPIHVYFPVEEAVAIRLLRDQHEAGRRSRPRGVFAFGDETAPAHEATLDYVELPSASDANLKLVGSALGRATIANPDGSLYPGLSARGRLTLSQPSPAVLVEPSGVGYDPSGPYVLVCEDQHVLRQRYVELGDLVDGMRVIRNRRDRDGQRGLDPDELYVVNGLARARPGRPIRVEVPRDEDETSRLGLGDPEPKQK